MSILDSDEAVLEAAADSNDAGFLLFGSESSVFGRYPEKVILSAKPSEYLTLLVVPCAGNGSEGGDGASCFI